MLCYTQQDNDIIIHVEITDLIFGSLNVHFIKDKLIRDTPFLLTHKRVIIDCTLMKKIDSLIIGVLLNLVQMSRSVTKENRIYLYNANETLIKVFELLNVKDLFNFIEVI